MKSENKTSKEKTTIVESSQKSEVKKANEDLLMQQAQTILKLPVKGKESRREELLKQLKAVEDAIAKKKSKII